MADHEVWTEVRQDENRPTTPEERRWLSQLRWIRRARDYSMGWVKHTFRARFGVWVEDAGTDLMRYPDADVLAFSLAKLSAYWRADLRSDDEDVADRSAAFVASLEAWRDDEEREPAPPPSSGRVHFRGTGGSACGHLREWHLKNVPHRFSEDPSEVTCTHCRNGQGRPQCRPVAPPARPLERAPAPRVVPVCFRHDGGETRH
jgi:hypothetical protein